MQAATRAFGDLGFDATTMDEVADRAGISRATLYRRYPSREELFVAVLLARAAEYFEATRTRSSSGGLAVELEDSTVLGVIEMPSDPVLRSLYDQGTRGLDVVMTNPRFRAAVTDAVRPLLQRWRRRGELRRELDFEEVTEWMVHEQFALIARGPWDEAALRQYVRTFMTPVLRAAPKRSAPESSRFDEVLARLDRLEALMAATAENARLSAD